MEKAAERLSERILELCIEKGGSITGEHGVGLAKRAWLRQQMGEGSFELMKQAVDVGVDMISVTVGWQEAPESSIGRDIPAFGFANSRAGMTRVSLNTSRSPGVTSSGIAGTSRPRNDGGRVYCGYSSSPSLKALPAPVATAGRCRAGSTRCALRRWASRGRSPRC